jgi:hypothetical protein
MAGHRLRRGQEPQWATKYVPTRWLPYGRRPDSHDLMGDGRMTYLPADWFEVKRPIPMPNGGERWLTRCPRCQVWRKELYLLGASWVCRRCAGLRYRSEYQGRRPEAGGLWDTSRLDALIATITRARTPAAFDKRLARFHAVLETRGRRERAYLRRFSRHMDAFIRGCVLELARHHAAAELAAEARVRRAAKR